MIYNNNELNIIAKNNSFRKGIIYKLEKKNKFLKIDNFIFFNVQNDLNKNYLIKNNYSFFKTNYGVFNSVYEEWLNKKFIKNLIERSVDLNLLKQLNFLYSKVNKIYIKKNVKIQKKKKNFIENIFFSTLKKKYFQFFISNIKKIIKKFFKLNYLNLNFFSKKKILNFCLLTNFSLIKTSLNFFLNLFLQKFFFDFFILNYYNFFFSNIKKHYLKNFFYFFQFNLHLKLLNFNNSYFFLYKSKHFDLLSKKKFLLKNSFSFNDFDVSLKKNNLNFNTFINLSNLDYNNVNKQEIKKKNYNEFFGFELKNFFFLFFSRFFTYYSLSYKLFLKNRKIFLKKNNNKFKILIKKKKKSN